MGKVSGQNLIIRFVHIILVIGGKCSKTTRTQEVQGMGTNPFKLFLVSLSSTNWYTSDSKRRVTLGYLPSLVKVFSEDVYSKSIVYNMLSYFSSRYDHLV